ncbi:LPXTG cell wall anchor domain-containing protein [Streptomyces sp. NPDC049837]|uniref:LPXTG cell wall anchor domain-containing protein n=1 Tax=Streptomyces sp. NPDC049837 TaxID=3155277 RepID=UPI003428956C
MLATAVVAAVTTPAVLLSVTPAYAEVPPPVGRSFAGNAAKPSLKELEKAAAEAQKAYDAAVAEEVAALQALIDEQSDEAPLAVAAVTAAKEAKAAATAKEAADKALAEAQAALKELPETATEAERAQAEKDVADAQAAAEAAARAKDAADAKAEAADTARDDALVAASRRIHLARQEKAKALAAKEAADKALAEAREEAEAGACVAEDRLTVTATGLPAKVTAGTTVDFTVRVTNGTDRTLDEVWPYVEVEAGGDLLDVQWSTAASPAWQDVDADHYAGAVDKLAPGAHADVKLRVKTDAKTPAGPGVASLAADYANDDKSCGGTPEFYEYAFDVVAASTTPAPTTTPTATPDPQPQGTTSPLPVTTTPSPGTLAATGASSATPLALAAGAAVALGAGTLFAARRRKATTER